MSKFQIEHKKLEKAISVRLTEAELGELTQKATEAGTTRNVLARQMICHCLKDLATDNP